MSGPTCTPHAATKMHTPDRSAAGCAVSLLAVLSNIPFQVTPAGKRGFHAPMGHGTRLCGDLWQLPATAVGRHAQREAGNEAHGRRHGRRAPATTTATVHATLASAMLGELDRQGSTTRPSKATWSYKSSVGRQPRASGTKFLPTEPLACIAASRAGHVLWDVPCRHRCTFPRTLLDSGRPTRD